MKMKQRKVGNAHYTRGDMCPQCKSRAISHNKRENKPKNPYQEHLCRKCFAWWLTDKPNFHRVTSMKNSKLGNSGKRDYHARLVVYGVSQWPKKSVKAFANWLRENADHAEKHSSEYANTFVARLMK